MYSGVVVRRLCSPALPAWRLSGPATRLLLVRWRWLSWLRPVSVTLAGMTIVLSFLCFHGSICYCPHCERIPAAAWMPLLNSWHLPRIPALLAHVRGMYSWRKPLVLYSLVAVTRSRIAVYARRSPACLVLASWFPRVLKLRWLVVESDPRVPGRSGPLRRERLVHSVPVMPESLEFGDSLPLSCGISDRMVWDDYNCISNNALHLPCLTCPAAFFWAWRKEISVRLPALLLHFTVLY